MPEASSVRLSDVADIRPSNVDKKANKGEPPVRLCNYMDVYSNEYITDQLPFMEATATSTEIKRFSVALGDILITKDSETPDDIGIPSVVLSTVESLVCGYHLALIRPDRNLVDPIFLSKVLSSAPIASYFGRVANGSTRYGLTYRAIANTPIRVFPVEVQHRIGKILKAVDEAITQTEALIAKTQQIKAGLMHDLFTRGVTPDGKLRPPREEAPKLYKETPIGWVPKEWEVELLDHVSQRGSGHTPNRNKPEYWNGGVKWISLADSWRLDQVHISDTDFQISQLGIQNSSACRHPAGIVVLSRDAGVGKSAITTCEMAVSQHFMCWRCGPRLNNYFLYFWLQYQKRHFENIAMGSTIPTIGLRFFKHYRTPVPQKLEEQIYISQTLLAAEGRAQCLARELQKLRQVKAGLMHALLSERPNRTSELVSP